MGTAVAILPDAAASRHHWLCSRLGERSRVLENQLGGLAREFDTDLPRERIIEICDDVLESLLSHARFTHFIPVLTYRYARERLRLEALALD